MKTDYIIGGSMLLPCLPYPRFLLGVNVRLIAKEVYAVLLDRKLVHSCCNYDCGDCLLLDNGECVLCGAALVPIAL